MILDLQHGVLRSHGKLVDLLKTVIYAQSDTKHVQLDYISLLLHGESLLLETEREQLGVAVSVTLVASQLNLHRLDVELQAEVDRSECLVCLLYS